jgi:hypothetical protein
MPIPGHFETKCARRTPLRPVLHARGQCPGWDVGHRLGLFFPELWAIDKISVGVGGSVGLQSGNA